MRKYILMFIICVSSFIIYTNKVHALIDTVAFENYGINTSGSFSNQTYSKNLYFNTSGIFANYSGWVLFTLTYYSPSGSVSTSNPIINSIGVLSGSQILTCDIGTIASFTDNTTSAISYTANCPVVFGPNGITGIVLEKSYNGVGQFRLSNNITFYDNREQNQNVVSQLQFSTNDILSLLGSINVNNVNNFNNISSQISSILTAIQNSANIQQQISSNTQQAANNTNDIKNDIKDSSIDNNNATGTINNLSGQLANDNTITSLLLLPINFINVLIDGLSGQCVPYTLGELWGSNITMPCVDLYQQFGAIWYMVDTGLSALVIFKMSKYFIRLFNKLTNLKDGGLEEAYS